MEESHLLSGVIIHTDRLTFNSDCCQVFHRLLHALHTKCKVTQTAGLWAIHTLRRIFLSENLKFRKFIDTKIQLPILALRAIIFSDNRESQLVHIEILCGFVVRYDHCDVVYFR